MFLQQCQRTGLASNRFQQMNWDRMMTLNNGCFYFASTERCTAHHRVPCVSVAELLAFCFAFWICFQNKLFSLQAIKRSTFRAKDRETNILSWFTWINTTFYVTPVTFHGFNRNYFTNASIGFASAFAAPSYSLLFLSSITGTFIKWDKLYFIMWWFDIVSSLHLQGGNLISHFHEKAE